MTVPVLTFENHRTGLQVELGGNDLPAPPIQWGGRTRKEVTRYIGTDRVSVQVLGVEHNNPEISGILDDTYTGNPVGHAQAKRAELEQLLFSGDLIKMSYNRDQVWGFMDIDFDEEVDDRILYTLRFEVLMRTPPKPVILVLNQSPVDTASSISEEFDALKDITELVPDEVNTSLARDVLLALGKADAFLLNASKPLSTVVYYGDLTAEIAGNVNRSMSGAFKNVGVMLDRLRSAQDSTLSSVEGSGELLATGWRDDVLIQAQLANERILAFLLVLAGVLKPDSIKTHIVREGETLESIAHFYYGDFSLSTYIADANGLDFLDISPNDRLTIPREPVT